MAADSMNEREGERKVQELKNQVNGLPDGPNYNDIAS